MAEQNAPNDRDPCRPPQPQDGRASGHVTKHMTRVTFNGTPRKAAEASGGRGLILGHFRWPPGLLLTVQWYSQTAKKKIKVPPAIYYIVSEHHRLTGVQGDSI
ncbi:UNVERIFIED_CONTAM: hypothetical protein FKN15_028528 [Acipenser sinensis]